MRTKEVVLIARHDCAAGAADGRAFDDGATFQISDTMPGWQEGLQMMRVGDKRRFWIPGRLAYGDQPGTPQGMLVYDIDLVQFVD